MQGLGFWGFRFLGLGACVSRFRVFRFRTRTEMDWCRVVGPRSLCRPLDKKQGLATINNPSLAPCEGCSTCNHLSWRKKVVPINLPYNPQTREVAPQDRPAPWNLSGTCLASDPSWKRAVGPAPHPGRPKKPSQFRPRLLEGFTLSHRPVETLGRGPRWEPRAPSAALSAVSSLRRVWKLGV